jgi:hypothetical protein
VLSSSSRPTPALGRTTILGTAPSLAGPPLCQRLDKFDPYKQESCCLTQLLKLQRVDMGGAAHRRAHARNDRSLARPTALPHFPDMRTVAETAIFQRYASQVWADAERQEFITWIAANPEQRIEDALNDG